MPTQVVSWCVPVTKHLTALCVYRLRNTLLGLVAVGYLTHDMAYLCVLAYPSERLKRMVLRGPLLLNLVYGVRAKILHGQFGHT